MRARIATVAEMQLRELARRRLAVALLIALPLAFYAASAGHSPNAVITGGLAMAFSTAGVAVFSALAFAAVDGRLALSGYRPAELLLGRLLALEGFGLCVAGLFSAVIIAGTGPERPGLVVLGVVVVAVISAPFGLAVGELVPRDLEATLVLIGVVGVELTLGSDTTIAKALPFWGADRVLDESLRSRGAIGGALTAAAAYTGALLIVAMLLHARRCGGRTLPSPQPEDRPVLDGGSRRV